MAERMTEERLADIRALLHGSQVPHRAAMTCAHELLAELDAVATERDALQKRANEIPGMSARLDELEWAAKHVDALAARG